MKRTVKFSYPFIMNAGFKFKCVCGGGGSKIDFHFFFMQSHRANVKVGGAAAKVARGSCPLCSPASWVLALYIASLTRKVWRLSLSL